MTHLTIQPYTLPGARLGPENPLPFFRDPTINRPVAVIEPFPPEKLDHLGWETAFRVLPYTLQDQYTRQKAPLTFQSVVLENEHLHATFLPEVGGRLVSLVSLADGRELLHRNPVFQPANLAIRNAWFSGGIEWNIGQYGHTVFTCSPVFAAAIQGAQGEPGLRLYEFERSKRLFWQLDFYLPPGLPFLVAYARVINPNAEPAAMYWWTNIAVDEAPGVRVLAPTNTALYGAFTKAGPAFGATGLPGLPTLDGADGTYSLNSTFANEFFFQCDTPSLPWEAALGADGRGLVEASTARLKYRKLFCWGTHAGGRQWQEFLSQPGQAYIEIQAGLAPTQVHGLPMPPHTAWDWTEVFGELRADPGRVHSPDWPAAWKAVEAALHERLSPATLYQVESGCRALADQPPREILQAGSGWGALELLRRQASAPGGEPLLAHAPACFPPSTLGAEQAPWLALLETGALPSGDPRSLPGAWMVQPEWEALLEDSVQAGRSQGWGALLHLGVMRLEALDEPGAEAAWQESLRRQPSAWAYRNLAVLAQRQGQPERALALYEQAWDLAGQMQAPPPALAVEYLRLVVAAGQVRRGLEIYQALPPEVQAIDRVQLLRGQFALALDDLDTVEEVLARPYAEIREGETTLTDLWFELHTRREAARSGRAPDDALRAEVRRRFPPPAAIDFRSFND